MGGAVVSLEIRTAQGTLNVTALCEGAMPLDRAREFAVRQGRAAESGVWQVFGDGLEQPSTLQWRVTLKRGTTRAWQRQAIDTLEAWCRAATSIYNIPDGRENLVRVGHVTQESPTEESYALVLTFWPSQAQAAAPATADTGVY